MVAENAACTAGAQVGQLASAEVKWCTVSALQEVKGCWVVLVTASPALRAMAEVAQALAALHLPKHPADDCSLPSPKHLRLQTTALSFRATQLFPDTIADCQSSLVLQPCIPDAVSEADKQAAWGAIVGDLFQAVIEHLPAHTAQHAMLVCRHWHDSVTDGLEYLRPRALRLGCINSRSLFLTDTHPPFLSFA